MLPRTRTAPWSVTYSRAGTSPKAESEATGRLRESVLPMTSDPLYFLVFPISTKLTERPTTTHHRLSSGGRACTLEKFLTSRRTLTITISSRRDDDALGSRCDFQYFFKSQPDAQLCPRIGG